MNPYEILGVPPHSSDAEVKSAYRRLVKQFHPDVSTGQHDGMIKQLNEAYKILSNPARKAAYDQATVVITLEDEEENPQELERREYIAQQEDERRKKKEALSLRLQSIYKFLRLIAFPAFIFACLVILDRYLPQHEHNEVAIDGWQQQIGKGNSGRPLMSFMETKHFIIAVPHEMHLNYDYSANNREILKIKISPIFEIPTTVSVVQKDVRYSADINETIYTHAGRLHYILLLTSLFTIFRKDYSNVNFLLALIPTSLLFYIWLIFF